MNNQTPSFSITLLKPRYWSIWLGLGLGWLGAQLPFSTQIKIGQTLGKLLYKFSPRRVRIAKINLDLCFPDKTENERENLLKQNFISLGISIMETSMSWWMPTHRLKKKVSIQGLEHLESALSKQQGVILLSGHFTTLEIGGRLLSLYAPFHVLYREHKNKVFEYVMHRARTKHYEKAIERGNIRGMLRSLKQKKAVWYAPDQNYGREQSIFVTFFKIPAATITATSRLASLNNSPVVPFFQQRLDNNKGYLLRLYPALEAFPSDDEVADTQRINHIIEDEILKMPEQYLWAHRRFKSRPDHLPPVY